MGHERGSEGVGICRCVFHPFNVCIMHMWCLQMCKTAPKLSERHLPVFFVGLLKCHTTGSERERERERGGKGHRRK